jgi:two-component system nitrate/nitrite sensor histidine kinase NarX
MTNSVAWPEWLQPDGRTPAEAYSTLEERVEARNRSLAERNHELGILYSVTAFLSEPAPMESCAKAFSSLIKQALGADGGRSASTCPFRQSALSDDHDGLSEEFIAREAEMNCGDCLCGDVGPSGADGV